MEKNKNQIQQPEVKENISPSQGEGGCTETCLTGVNSGFASRGGQAKNPSADPMDERLEFYKRFKVKCWGYGITDKEEIVLLYKIFTL